MSTKRAHLLKSPKSTELPTRLLFYDTETNMEHISDNETKHTLKLGWICYWQRKRAKQPEKIVWHTFTTVEEFWDILLSYAKPKIRLLVIAHNQTFDAAIVDAYNQLPKLGYECKRLYDKKPVYIALYEKETSRLLFLDNANYHKSSLKELGNQVGLEKLEVEFDTCTNEELSIYCKRDVEILYETWRKWFVFHLANDLGPFAVTIAGQAFATYRHRFMHHEIYIHDRAWAYDLERQSYFGGRTECFYLGKIETGPITVVDVNSMYPAVMYTFDYPCKLVNRLRQISAYQLEDILKTYLVVAQVRLNTLEPVFPLRYNERLCFPIGSFQTCLATPEIAYALQHDYIQEVGDVIVYEGAPLFRDFVTFFWQERSKAKLIDDKAGALFYKLLLNSLYGKFGQKMEGWEIIGKAKEGQSGYWRDFDMDTMKWHSFRAVLDVVQEMKRYEEAYHSFPAVASHVTSWARQYLWELMLIAGRDNVYYCDTDSLFINNVGASNLESMHNNTQLGMLSNKGIYNRVEIKGPKSYTLDDKTTLKGIRKNAIQIAPNKYKQQQWPSLSSLIRDGLDKGYVVRDIIKTLNNTYTKGEVLESGKIIPYLLPR